MPTAWKMSIFLVFLLGLYVAFGGIMDFQLSHIAGLVERIHNHPMVVTRAALAASRDTIAISRNAKDMVLVKDLEHRKSRAAEIELYEKSVMQNIMLVKNRIEGEEGQRLVDQAIQLLNEQKDLQEKLVAAIFKDDAQEAASLTKNDGTQLMEKIESIMQQIDNYADSRSMEYRVESINDLKHAKIILFSAGFIIVLLSVAFALFWGRKTLRALHETRDTIRKAAQLPIDTTVQLKTGKMGHVNEAVNELFRSINGATTSLAHRAESLSSELLRAEEFEVHLPDALRQISDKLHDTSRSIHAFVKTYVDDGQPYQTFAELLGHIKGDLIVLGQYVASQQLLFDQLAQQAEHKNNQEVLQKLKDHQAAAKSYFARTILSVEKAATLIASLEKQFNSLHDIAISRLSVTTDIENLKQPIEHYEEHLAQLREILTQLQISLKAFKLF